MSDPVNILGWYRFDDRLTSSGQPSEEQLAALSDLGIKHIVNLGLHTHERALSDETASVGALGMAYIHIPVAFDAPAESDFDRFCAVMDALADQPIHVHCILNARVSAFCIAIVGTFLVYPSPSRVRRWRRFGSRAVSGRLLSGTKRRSKSSIVIIFRIADAAYGFPLSRE